MPGNFNDTTYILISRDRYRKSGIGGAGNFRRSTSYLTHPSEAHVSPKPSRGIFLTGIGGAGNLRSCDERASITLEHISAGNILRKQSLARSYHSGIGGVGNRNVFVSSSTSPSIQWNSSFHSAMARQSEADKVKDSVISFFNNVKDRFKIRSPVRKGLRL